MWPRGSGEVRGGFGSSQQEQDFAPVTTVQAASTRPEEPFFDSVFAEQGYIGSGATRRTVVASAGGS